MLHQWPTEWKPSRSSTGAPPAGTAAGQNVYTVQVPTSRGTLAVGATALGVCAVYFPDRAASADVSARMTATGMEPGNDGKHLALAAGLELMDYLAGKRRAFTVPVDYRFVSNFRRDIYRALTTVPPAETITYRELATLAGHAGKARAVGGAMGANPIPIIVPCHRVVSASGAGGWSGPAGWKRRLLDLERE